MWYNWKWIICKKLFNCLNIIAIDGRHYTFHGHIFSISQNNITFPSLSHYLFFFFSSYFHAQLDFRLYHELTHKMASEKNVLGRFFNCYISLSQFYLQWNPEKIETKRHFSHNNIYDEEFQTKKSNEKIT